MTVEGEQRNRKQARAAFKGGRYEEAVLYYERLLGNGEPGAAEGQLQDRVELGTALFRGGRYPEAERQLELVVEGDPLNASAHHKLGLISMRLGKPQRALEAFRAAAQAAPKEAAYQWAHAELAIALGERDEAEAALDASLALDPEHEEAKAAKHALAMNAALPPSARADHIADSEFASVLDFVRNRPGEDTLPERRVDTSYRPLFYVCAGSLAYLVIYLYVRLVMIG